MLFIPVLWHFLLFPHISKYFVKDLDLRVAWQILKPRVGCCLVLVLCLTKNLIACSISAFDGRAQLTLSSSWGSRMLGLSDEDGLFSNLWKCCAHRFSWSSSFRKTFPSLGWLICLNFPDSFFLLLFCTAPSCFSFLLHPAPEKRDLQSNFICPA